ncbi:phage tail protein, partial [Brachyspira innocens]|nr:phage tail protein [Brachyspira innocens]
GRNATGNVNYGDDGQGNIVGLISYLSYPTGVFYKGGRRSVILAGGVPREAYDIGINLSYAYTTANEFRVRNRLIRVYKLLTINGKTVSQIMAGV